MVREMEDPWLWTAVDHRGIGAHSANLEIMDCPSKSGREGVLNFKLLSCQLVAIVSSTLSLAPHQSSFYLEYFHEVEDPETAALPAFSAMIPVFICHCSVGGL